MHAVCLNKRIHSGFFLRCNFWSGLNEEDGEMGEEKYIHHARNRVSHERTKSIKSSDDAVRPSMNSTERFWRQLLYIPASCSLEKLWIEDYKSPQIRRALSYLDLITHICYANIKYRILEIGDPTNNWWHRETQPYPNHDGKSRTGILDQSPGTQRHNMVPLHFG